MADEQQGRKALKAGLGYTVGNILCKGLSFLSAFIFARLMTPADYGIYNTFSSYVSILSVAIGFALHASIKNARMDYENRLGSYCSSVTLLTIGNSLLFFLIAVIFRDSLSTALSIPATMVIIIVLESFATAMMTFYNEYLAVNFQSKRYLIISLVYAVSGTALSVLLVTTLFSQQRYLGRAYVTMVPLLFVAVYILYVIYRNHRPKVNLEYWKYGLRISLPIIPHGLSQLILAQFDRIMIKKSIGDTQAGLYSFANNIGFIFQVVTTSMDTAWCPWAFDRMKEKDYGSIRSKANVYVSFVSVMAAGLLLISPELILIMGGQEYADSRFVVLPIVLSVYYAFMYTLPACIEYYYKKTNIIAMSTMAAALLNVVLNSIFIPKIGYIAAAYTTVFCYLCYYILHVVCARKLHGSFIYDMRVMLLCLVAVTGFMFLCLWLVDMIWIRMAILLAGMLAAVIIGIKNKETILHLLRSLRK